MQYNIIFIFKFLEILYISYSIHLFYYIFHFLYIQYIESIFWSYKYNHNEFYYVWIYICNYIRYI